MQDFISQEAFGRYITKQRKKAGLTRARLAEKLFITEDAVAKWEKGKRFPEFIMVKKLADALGIMVQDIYDNSVEEENDIEKIISSILSILVVLFLIGGIVVGFKKNLKEYQAGKYQEETTIEETAEETTKEEMTNEESEEADKYSKEEVIDAAIASVKEQLGDKFEEFMSDDVVTKYVRTSIRGKDYANVDIIHETEEGPVGYIVTVSLEDLSIYLFDQYK